MPTKRRFILFIIVLALMMLIKRALGQETVGWDPNYSCFGSPSADLDTQVYGPMISGVFFGVISGMIRVKNRIWVETYAQERVANIIQLHLQ